jgi:hypothetical protein
MLQSCHLHQVHETPVFVPAAPVDKIAQIGASGAEDQLRSLQMVVSALGTSSKRQVLANRIRNHSISETSVAERKSGR